MLLRHASSLVTRRLAFRCCTLLSFALPSALGGCGGTNTHQQSNDDENATRDSGAGDPVTLDNSPTGDSDEVVAPNDPTLDTDGGSTEADDTVPSDLDPSPDANADDPLVAANCEETGAAASELRRLTAPQYRGAIDTIFDGRVAASAVFPAPNGTSTTGFSTELGYKSASEQDIEQVTLAAEDVAVSVVDVIDELLPCATDADPGDACLNEFLDRFGRRIYRRPLGEDERALLTVEHAGARNDGFTFAESIGVVVAHALQAPQFLYVAEDAAPSLRLLSGFELATRLSMLLWDSVPDEALLDLAEAGALDDVGGLRAEAERMLASENADPAIVRFFREWTQTTRVSPAEKSLELFPDFDMELAASINESFDRFVLDGVRSDATLKDLLSSSDAFVDAKLAPFFELDRAPAAWEKTALDAPRYRGLLTQPALLASLSHSDEPAPVFRGLLVQRRFLCNEFPPPPANAMSVEFDLPENPTARDRSEARRANGACVSCHSLIDPAGLAFEHFDAVGRYRESDSLGRSIDATGTLAGLSQGSLDFDDHIDLIRALGDEPRVFECAARQLYRFATSHRESDSEECAVAHVHEALVGDEGSFRSALVSIVTTSAFRYREDP